MLWPRTKSEKKTNNSVGKVALPSLVLCFCHEPSDGENVVQVVVRSSPWELNTPHVCIGCLDNLAFILFLTPFLVAAKKHACVKVYCHRQRPVFKSVFHLVPDRLLIEIIDDELNNEKSLQKNYTQYLVFILYGGIY